MTLVHLSMFSAMNFANSSGEFGSTATAPRSASRCWMNALDPPDRRDVADKFKAELFIESNVDRVELVADFDRCVFGCTNPLPTACFITGEEVPYRRKVWQQLQPS